MQIWTAFVHLLEQVLLTFFSWTGSAGLAIILFTIVFIDVIWCFCLYDEDIVSKRYRRDDWCDRISQFIGWGKRMNDISRKQKDIILTDVLIG